MKKLRILFAIIAIVAMMSTVVFADGSAVVFDSDSVAIVDNAVTITIKGAANFKTDGGSFFVDYDTNVWDFDAESAEKIDAGAQIIPYETNVGFSFNPSANTAVTTDQMIAVLKFTIKNTSDVEKAKATTFKISPSFLMDSDTFGVLTTEDEITVTGGSTPAVPEVKDVTTTATGTTFGNYKDVPLFDCAATIKNASKVFIAPELFLNGVSQGTKEKVEIPGLTADEAGANVVIKIAIVGADEGVVTINPNVTAE